MLLSLTCSSCLFITGSKSMDYSNGMFDCQSPTSPFMGSLRALHLLEDLRAVLECMDTEERESLRCQIPDSTAGSLVEWLQGHLVRGTCRRDACCMTLRLPGCHSAGNIVQIWYCTWDRFGGLIISLFIYSSRKLNLRD